jgi:hypothetical protein
MKTKKKSLKKDKYHLIKRTVPVRKEYGMKLKDDSGNIKMGNDHLMEITNNNPDSLSLIFVNLSDVPITIQYKSGLDWVSPTNHSRGKDKYAWSDIKSSNQFPKTDYHSTKQITGYLYSEWRILYKDKVYLFKLTPSKNKKNNKHIYFFSNKKRKINRKSLEDFLVYQIEEGNKLNISDGLQPSFNKK